MEAMQVWLDGDDDVDYWSMIEEEIVVSVLGAPSDF
jgi:hypothetical protein